VSRGEGKKKERKKGGGRKRKGGKPYSVDESRHSGWESHRITWRDSDRRLMEHAC
jgi:hypothetical protein